MMMMITTLMITMSIIIIIICCYLNKGSQEYRRICLVHSDDELERYHTQVPLLLD